MKRRFWRIMEWEPLLWAAWLMAGYMMFLCLLASLGAQL